MHYFTSTRDNNNKLSASKAILKGLADDGGLYTPNLSELNKLDLNFLLNLNYQELSVEILSTILDDYTRQEIEDIVYKAYDSKFSEKSVVSVLKKGDIEVLGLYHGPTCAFKDMALTVLPHLLTTAYKKQGESKTISILTATSGDTGKAALEGFKDVDNTFITVFFPQDGVSKIQERQMMTTGGKNTCVVKVKGNFDDCQKIVKEAFSSKEILSLDNISLSSANSINLGRLIPQVIYYVYSYLDLVRRNEIKMGEKISFAVPSGNFGNILAGFIAKEIGLPVNKLLCASNVNNVLTDFIKTGVYDSRREFYNTISPSMDIIVSSNVERLLYILSDYNDKEVAGYMKDLKEKGFYKVSDKVFDRIKETFISYYCDDDQTRKTIKDLYDYSNKVIDTHTAIAYSASVDYKKNNSDVIVCVSTASPYKFAKDVYTTLKDEEFDNEFMYLYKLEEISDEKIPEGLKDLENKKINFDNLIEKQDGVEFIFRKVENL